MWSNLPQTNLPLSSAKSRIDGIILYHFEIARQPKSYIVDFQKFRSMIWRLYVFQTLFATKDPTFPIIKCRYMTHVKTKQTDGEINIPSFGRLFVAEKPQNYPRGRPWVSCVNFTRIVPTVHSWFYRSDFTRDLRGRNTCFATRSWKVLNRTSSCNLLRPEKPPSTITHA